MLLEHFDKSEFSATISARVSNTQQLPALPEAAQALLRLRNDPNADILDLVNIVARDPSLASQVVRYAQLSIFGFGDRITSIQQAIALTLGFESALHLTLGIAAGKSLETPNDGPLARNIVWAHSLSAAALTQALAAKMPREIQPPRGLCYLAGLMHDFGLLLFGHWYPQHYAELSSRVNRGSETDLRETELCTFGISHDILVKQLMRAWNMPDEIVISCGEHHFSEYDGSHAPLVKLVALTNQLLDHPILNHSSTTLDTSILLKNLQLTEEQANNSLEKVKESMGEFSNLAKQIAA